MPYVPKDGEAPKHVLKDGEAPKKGGVLAALRRSPLVCEHLKLVRPREEGREVELCLPIVNPVRQSRNQR